MKPAAPVKPLWLRLRYLWDRLAVYLPMVVMSVMAMTTYWLVRNTPIVNESELELAPRHVPDYFMRDFSVRIFNVDGTLKSEVTGVEGRHFPDTDTLEIDQPRIRILGEQGRVVTATAGRGLVNADGTQAQLFDNAVVVREVFILGRDTQPSRSELHSDFLHIFANTEQVRSHLPVVLVRGGGDRFTADSLDYDNLDQVTHLHGRVHGTLQPPKN